MRTPQQQANDFIAANDKSPVVYGAVIEPAPNRPGRGGRYRLADGSSHRLGLEACRLLPEGYPKWRLP